MRWLLLLLIILSMSAFAQKTPVPLPSGCVLVPGVEAGFFRGPADFAFSQVDLRNNFINNNENGTQLLGKTLLPEINTGSTQRNNNPFIQDLNSNSDDNYITTIDGYITLNQSGIYQFAVNGDDAVEFEIFYKDGASDSSAIASWYGGHGPNHDPNATNNPVALGLPPRFRPIPGLIPVDINENFASGNYRFRFLHQEYLGGDSFFLYWKTPGSSSFVIVPSANLSNCVSQKIELFPSLTVLNDPFNSSNPKAIPGAEIRHTVTAKNTGDISTDSNSTELTQTIDEGYEFLVGSLQFIDGSGNQSSGLNMGNVTVTYMDASGASITPANGYTTTVRRIRMQFDGTFKAKFDTLEPEFSYQYQVRLQ